MTESQWAVSSDPAAMWAVVEATERQCGHALSAMYALAHWSSGDRSWPKPVIIETCGNWMTGNGYADEVPPAYRADLLREIFGNPWRRYSVEDGIVIRDIRLTDYGKHLRSYVLVDFAKWHDGAIPRMAQAIYGGICQECFGDEGCQYCDFQQETPFNPAAMPLLADMLEEAGCTDETILMHLRGKERCPWCIKGYVKYPEMDGETTQTCSSCRGDGWRPVTHVRGCWAVELFLPTMAISLPMSGKESSVDCQSNALEKP